VTEGFIDAISLGVIDGWPQDTAYASTDGGFGRATEAAIEELVRRAGPGAGLVAATDPDEGGELLAGRIQDVPRRAGTASRRLRPDAADWNDLLQQRRASDRRDP
jgi:hypothetical protein